MRNKHLSLPLAWFFTTLLAILSGCSQGAIEMTPSEQPSNPQAADHPTRTLGTTSLSPTHEAAAILTSTPIAPSANAPYSIIDPSDFSIDFKLDAPIPPGNYIVFAEDLYTFDPKVLVRFMTLSSDVLSSLVVEATNKGTSFSSYFIAHIHNSSNRILIGIEDDFKTKELYIYDLQTTNSWGISVKCDILSSELGRNYLAFRCFDDLETWYFVNTSDPSISYSITVPMPTHSFDSEPIWVDASEILFKGWRETFCLGSVPDWDPICEDLEYRPGQFATNVRLLELREGDYYRPTAIGALSIDCLRSGSPDCDPILIENPFNDPQAGAINPLSSSWVPGTSSILYLMMIDYDQNTNAADETELWLATYPEGTIAKIDVLEGEFVLAELGFPDMPAIWLPGGKEVVLNGLNDLVIYNIETGEQRSIGYHGKVLGTIEIK